MAAKTTQTLTLLVDNEFGVLTRITALVRREGWNIKSLAVAETLDAAVSRLTLTVECLDSSLPRVLQRLGKLNCVREILVFSPETHVDRELALVKINFDYGLLQSIAESFGARLLIQSEHTMLEISDTPEIIDRFIEELKKLGEFSIARSGVVTLENSDGEKKQ